MRFVDASKPSSATAKKKYVVCGLSNRAISNFILPLIGDPGLREYGDFSAYGEVAGILDVDLERVQAFNGTMGVHIPAYSPNDFDRMITETNADTVIVTSPDGSHVDYIIKALTHHLDVITEKPMVIDCQQALAVIEEERRSRGSVRVTHNERYRQANLQIKRMIQNGLLGRITNVELVYNIDTYHGSSYFRRWNRDRTKSGGLTIHKGSHHFDLINWWLDDVPEQAFAYGTLNFYGANSPFNPSSQEGKDYSVAEQVERCPYHRRWNSPGATPPKDDHLAAREKVLRLPYNVQYSHDDPLYIYDQEIEIEDTYSALVRYRRGASMAYTANFSAPWEGYSLAINGTQGRIESIRYSAPSRCPFPASDRQTIMYYPIFGERQIHETRPMIGGHGGSDPLLQHDLFVGPSMESLEVGRVAGSLDGAYAVAVGEAVWRSVQENRLMTITELLALDSVEV